MDDINVFWITVIVITALLGLILVYRKLEKARTIQKNEMAINSICPRARILVNTDQYVFFVDDEMCTFGFDISGHMYRWTGIKAVFSSLNSIRLTHEDIPQDVEFGFYGQRMKPLSYSEVKAIEKEALVYVRKKLNITLQEHGVIPTHEYLHDGTIWGCDINSKQFYTTYSRAEVFDFADLMEVTIEDVSLNKNYGSKYIIHARVDDKLFPEGFEYDISFDEKNALFYDLLSMFKGIRARQKR